MAHVGVGRVPIALGQVLCNLLAHALRPPGVAVRAQAAREVLQDLLGARYGVRREHVANPRVIQQRGGDGQREHLRWGIHPHQHQFFLALPPQSVTLAL